MYRYTVINVSDSPKRALLIRTRDIFSAILGLRDIKLNFIREDPNGPVHYDYPILGYVHLNGKEIFIRADIYDLREQVRTVLHELRHCYQRQSGRHYATNAARERDARLFEYEYLPPFDPAAIERCQNPFRKSVIEPLPDGWRRTKRRYCSNRCKQDGYALRRAKALLNTKLAASSFTALGSRMSQEYPSKYAERLSAPRLNGH